MNAKQKGKTLQDKRTIRSANLVVKSKSTEATPLKELNQEFKNYLLKFKLPVRKTASGAVAFTDYLNDRLFMVEVIRKGITYSLFEEIQKLSSLTSQEWATILNLSTRSLQRYKEQDQLFKPIQSEKIMELGEIFILGNEVFGDADKFKRWLETPSYAIGNVRPAELLADSFGQQLVTEELNRIQYGIFT
jgi:putative toxin-antitoxin system antitoxin component (TIGR02293 family)